MQNHSISINYEALSSTPNTTLTDLQSQVSVLQTTQNIPEKKGNTTERIMIVKKQRPVFGKTPHLHLPTWQHFKYNDAISYNYQQNENHDRLMVTTTNIINKYMIKKVIWWKTRSCVSYLCFPLNPYFVANGISLLTYQEKLYKKQPSCKITAYQWQTNFYIFFHWQPKRK